MDRPTTEITLPDSKIRVVLYEYLTYGQSRQIKKTAMDSMRIKVNKDTQDFDIQDISAGFQLTAEDQTVSFLIKEMFNAANEPMTNILTVINDELSQTDGDFLYAKVNELSMTSSLSEEDKKKLLSQP